MHMQHFEKIIVLNNYYIGVLISEVYFINSSTISKEAYNITFIIDK